MAKKILVAASTHDVIVWFCGLSSPEQHIRRVAARVKAGGHDIPETTIRERFPQSLHNLIALMPHASSLRVHDNSAEVEPGEPVPDPVLVLEMADGKVIFPATDDGKALGRTPEWAKPLVEAAIVGSQAPGGAGRYRHAVAANRRTEGAGRRWKQSRVRPHRVTSSTWSKGR